MPLPLTVSCSSKIQIAFTFLVLAHLGSAKGREADVQTMFIIIIMLTKCWPLQMLTNVRACMHGHTHAIMYLAAVIVKHNTETVTVLTAQWLDSADDTFHRWDNCQADTRWYRHHRTVVQCMHSASWCTPTGRRSTCHWCWWAVAPN